MARPPFDPNRIQTPKRGNSPAKRSPLSVSQITSLVKNAIETTLPTTVHVVGEVSNLKQAASGHLYLTLKDSASELSCVMWRSAADGLKFSPANGMEVVASGRVEVFERAGRYQLYVRKLEPKGVGTLELAFRQLCERLEREGLFDAEHKKPIPPYPQTIALITSPTGAAVADVLRTLGRRFPCVRILVYPVFVQGDRAAENIAAAINRINANDSALGGVDVMIVGRGGGSIEDLWAFNEEAVARAIHASRVPIISAVGHEVDVTVADLVADVRAATPTAAAELAVPVLDDVLCDLANRQTRILRAVLGRHELLSARLSGVVKRSAFYEPRGPVHRREQVLDELSRRMHAALTHKISRLRRVVDAIDPLVQRIAPHAHLSRRSVELRDAAHRLRWAMSRRMAVADRAIVERAHRLERSSPDHRLIHDVERLRRVASRLMSGMDYGLQLRQAHLQRQEDVLAAMSYRSVLGRGFSITRTKRGRKVVRSVGQLRDGERTVSELIDGEFESEVVNLNQLELFE